jgi:prophage regulatory protein
MADLPKNESTERVSLKDAPEFVTAKILHRATGIPEGTWRYWASIGYGPGSFLLGRRRVWRSASVLDWIEKQEAAASTA